MALGSNMLKSILPNSSPNCFMLSLNSGPRPPKPLPSCQWRIPRRCGTSFLASFAVSFVSVPLRRTVSVTLVPSLKLRMSFANWFGSVRI